MISKSQYIQLVIKLGYAISCQALQYRDDTNHHLTSRDHAQRREDAPRQVLYPVGKEKHLANWQCHCYDQPGQDVKISISSSILDEQRSSELGFENNIDMQCDMETKAHNGNDRTIQRVLAGRFGIGVSISGNNAIHICHYQYQPLQINLGSKMKPCYICQ